MLRGEVLSALKKSDKNSNKTPVGRSVVLRPTNPIRRSIPANMTAKKYNKKHRVVDLDARDARRRERSVGRSATKWAKAVLALNEVRRRPCRVPGRVPL